jgi:hypothetical protein
MSAQKTLTGPLAERRLIGGKRRKAALLSATQRRQFSTQTKSFAEARLNGCFLQKPPFCIRDRAGPAQEGSWVAS